jgi:hypothetical protein
VPHSSDRGYDIEDPPTEVMFPDQSMADLVNSSQPSAVTSPTQTEATYSLMPPPNRNGMIAVFVAGAILLSVLIAVFVGGSPDGDNQNLADPAAPLPDFDDSADTPDWAKPPDVPSPAPSGSNATGESPSALPSSSSSKPSPVAPRRGGKRRKKSDPDPEPGKPFKPKTL